jgi:flagellar motor protein MotB
MAPRRRRGVVAEEYGEGYLASVSDLMSGLIFIFVITLCVFALRLAETAEAQRKQTEELKEKTQQLDSAKETRERLLVNIKERLEKFGVRVEIIPEQGVLRLSEEGIHFPSGSTQPIPDHAPRVGRLARVLSEVLPCYVASRGAEDTWGALDRPDYCIENLASSEKYVCDRESAHLETVLIEGHTDQLPVRRGNRFLDNLELSSMRAAEILRMVEACEPTLQGLWNTENLQVLSTSGYGSTRLAIREDPTAEENRRIDLRFLMELPHETRAATAVPADDALVPRRAVREGYGP